MRRKTLWGLAALLLVGAADVSAGAPDGFLHNGVTAHRGNSSEFPENTIPAFQSGIHLGADWIELDVHRTRDGQLAVSHDRTTGRVGDQDLVVPECSYAELRAVDVAASFRRERGKTLDQCPKHTMPLLEEVLRLVMTQNRTRLSIQPKMDCVADAVKLVRRLGAENWVGFNDSTLDYMVGAKKLLPAVPVFYDRHQTNLLEDIRVARQHGFQALVLHHTLINEARVRLIHAAGLEAGAWTVNDEAEMNHLLNLGVDRVYTDYPGRVLALKRQRARYQSASCEGTYPRHLQGICLDGKGAIYWSFTDALVKTDAVGKVLKKVAVANHHGDLCYHDGKLYVTVNLGKFNEPPGKADSWVYVYAVGNLTELARHRVPEVVHGAGGIGWHAGRFMVVGGLPPGANENPVHEYDPNIRYVRTHIIRSGYTLMGIQTAEFSNGYWWFGCYGNPRILLKTDDSFRLVGRYEVDCAFGLAGLPNGRFLIGRGANDARKAYVGHVVLARADEIKGLVVEDAERSAGR
ncbi:MAG TPA: glycerophosphodiester phosphodiesterase family protein [Candidatus Paceibacterota bacterium]|nr:glycerophosphodiester phosphodiesterase family protein [Verrucomicrobiota bacterium]HSA11464.1 glycerophosphodiester phosphodiesterase family protein [Candidatus Paceibacterota bacterium]